jgi:hypothetical protein
MRANFYERVFQLTVQPGFVYTDVMLLSKPKRILPPPKP